MVQPDNTQVGCCQASAKVLKRGSMDGVSGRFEDGPLFDCGLVLFGRRVAKQKGRRVTVRTKHQLKQASTTNKKGTVTRSNCRIRRARRCLGAARRPRPPSPRLRARRPPGDSTTRSSWYRRGPHRCSNPGTAVESGGELALRVCSPRRPRCAPMARLSRKRAGWIRGGGRRRSEPPWATASTAAW